MHNDTIVCIIRQGRGQSPTTSPMVHQKSESVYGLHLKQIPISNASALLIKQFTIRKQEFLVLVFHL